MKNFSKNDIWNVAIVGHSGVGKTTLTESIIKITESSDRIGSIEKGNTTSDFLDEEVKRRSSINSSLIPVFWKDTKINFLDAPGYYDHIGEMEQVMSIADIALIVISAKEGIEAGTERAFEMATKLSIPKIIYVSNMEEDTTHLPGIIAELKGRFGKNIAPVQVPFYEDDKFTGFVNTIKKAGRRFVNGRTQECDCPDDVRGQVDDVHNLLCEAVAETDEELMEKFFNEENFSIEEIESGIKNGIITGEVTPVFCGSASEDIGTRVLLNSIIKFVPNTANLNSSNLAKDLETGEDIELLYNKDETLSAFVFKTMSDPYVGKLTFFKVLSGTLKVGDTVLNANADTKEKISSLFTMRGKTQIPLEEVRCGDIGVVNKSLSFATGNTICAANRRIVLYKEIPYSKNLTFVAISPVNKKDEDKLSDAFHKIMEEDKTISFYFNSDTKETVLQAMGLTHIEVIKNKLKDYYKIDVDIRDAKTPYKETLLSKITIREKYKKQSGGHGQYGDVEIEFEPSGLYDEAFEFEEKVFGGAVPKQYFPAVEKGFQDSVKDGYLAGYPIVGLKGTLVDGSYHPVDSSEQAFKMATMGAIKRAFLEGKTAILEPIYNVEVKVNEIDIGTIMGDITKRGGRVLGVNKEGDKAVIVGEAPLTKLLKYAVDLRAMTKGRGVFDISYSRYDKVSEEEKERIIKESN